MTPTDTPPTDTLAKSADNLHTVVEETLTALLNARGPRGVAHDLAEVCLDMCQYDLLPPLLEAIQRYDAARWTDPSRRSCARRQRWRRCTRRSQATRPTCKSRPRKRHEPA